jgi:hypothetical protein
MKIRLNEEDRLTIVEQQYGGRLYDLDDEIVEEFQIVAARFQWLQDLLYDLTGL